MYHVLRVNGEARPPHLIQFDGGSRGNPGISGAGCVLYQPCTREDPLLVQSVYLGTATNKEAEYMGLLTGLKMAAMAGVKHLLIEGDSKLVVDQVRGEWKVKSPRLKELHARACIALMAFDYAAIRHIDRKNNAAADKAANAAMDAGPGPLKMEPHQRAFFGNLDFVI
jgi:ribonuclease HI